MCSGASFNIRNNKINITQRGGYYGGNLETTGAVEIKVNDDMDFEDIKEVLSNNFTKRDLIEILAGIVKFSDE